MQSVKQGKGSDLGDKLSLTIDSNGLLHYKRRYCNFGLSESANTQNFYARKTTTQDW